MKNFPFFFLLFVCFCLTSLPSWSQDSFSYGQKEFELAFVQNGVERVASCQAVRIHRNWFLTAAHCVSPCKKYKCDIRMWLALGPARASVSLDSKHVFIPAAYEDEYTLPPGAKIQKKLQPWDMALIRYAPEEEDFSYHDAGGPIKEAEFLQTLDEAFWQDKIDQTRQQADEIYAQIRELAAAGRDEEAQELTQYAQEMELDIESYRRAAEAVPELNRQWKGAVEPRLAPLLTYEDTKEKLLLSNILVPRWVHGDFENRSSPNRVLYFGDKQAVWISNGFGVTPGNSGGGVFLPVYNGGKKQTSGLVGTVSARSLNILPDHLRSRYQLPGQDLFLFIGFSENTTLAFIRQVMGEFRQRPNVRLLTKFGTVKDITDEK